MKDNGKKEKKMIVHILAGILTIIFTGSIILLGLFRLSSPGEIRPVVDEEGKEIEGSIAEKIYVDINGVRQGMIIRSSNENNPVLLFVHGGPGLNEYFMDSKYRTGLDENFTVCWWDQRGTGLSYIPGTEIKDIKRHTIEDTIAVTNYLRERFHQEKIYIMGHSWGSFIGMYAVQEEPELYQAYIGVGQLSRQWESEKLAYQYMLDYYRNTGNKKMAKKLEKYSIMELDRLPDSYEALRDKAMHEAGIGTTHKMKSVITGIFLESLTCREYTMKEKINLWRGKSASGMDTLNQVCATDLTKEIPEIKVPVYFFQGIYDYTANYGEAKKYFDKLKAPVKGFYTFENSAHSPIFEEPEKCKKIMVQDVLTGSTHMADQ